LFQELHLHSNVLREKDLNIPCEEEIMSDDTDDNESTISSESEEEYDFTTEYGKL
jgi:hypothetical protein